MDSENNISTTSETLPKTSEHAEKPPQNSMDPNKNPFRGDGDAPVTTKEGKTPIDDALPASSVVVDQENLKDSMLKNVSNENDPNSEDIELKWDDDSDVDLSVVSDFVSDFIATEELGDSDEVSKAGGDGDAKSTTDNDDEILRDNERDGIEVMDVDTSEIEDVTNKIDDLVKINDNESSRMNIEENSSISNNNDKKESADLEKGSAMINVTEKSMNVDSSNIIEDILTEVPLKETTTETKDTSKPHTSMIEEPPGLKNSETKEVESSPSSEIKPSTSILEDENLKDEIKMDQGDLEMGPYSKKFTDNTEANEGTSGAACVVASMDRDCNSSKAVPSLLLSKVSESKEVQSSSSAEIKPSASILEDENLNKMDLNTSEITEIAPDSGKFTEITEANEVTSDASTEAAMYGDADSSLEVSSSFFQKNIPSLSENTVAIGRATSEIKNLLSVTEIKPDSPTKNLDSRSDHLEEVHVSSNLSDVEEDDQIVPSKEEEDILLAEPSSTDNQLDTVTSNTLKVQPDASDAVLNTLDAAKDAPDTFDMAVDALDKILEVTSSENISTTTADLSKKQYVADEVPNVSKDQTLSTVEVTTDTEPMAIDTSDVIPEISDNLGLLAKPKQPDTEAMICDTSNVLSDESIGPDSAAVTPKDTEATSLLDKPINSTSNQEDMESLLPLSNINPDVPDKTQITLDASGIVSNASEPITSTGNPLETNAVVLNTLEVTQTLDNSYKIPEVIGSSELITQTVTPSHTLQEQSVEEIVSDASDTVQVIPDILDTVQIVPDVSNAIQIASNEHVMATDASDLIPKVTEAESMAHNASEITQTASDTVQVDITQKVPTILGESQKHDACNPLEKPSTSTSNDVSSETVQSSSNISAVVEKAPEAPETVQSTPDTPKPLQKIPSISIKTPEAINNLGPSYTDSNQLTTKIVAPIAAETIQIPPETSGPLQMATSDPDKTLETIKMPSDTSESIQITTDDPDKTLQHPGPSTSANNQLAMAPDASDEAQQLTDSLGLLAESTRPIEEEDDMQEFTDSLGLLAESSGPMDEEEEPEMEEEDDADDDEEVEDDQDDESNHPTTADQSEDSNAQTSETDVPNTTDIEISEDSFAEKLGTTRMGIAQLADRTETAKEVEDMDVDNEFDKLLASVTPEKQKIATVAEQAKSPEKPDDAMEADDAKATDSTETADKGRILREVLTSPRADRAKGEGTPPTEQDKAADTPSKVKKLARWSNSSMSVVNIVDLEGSSSEDDVLDTTGAAKPPSPTPETNEDGTTDDAAKQDETVVKPAAPKARIRLNTDELTIKTAAAGTESTLVIPEAKLEDIPQPGKPPTPKFSLEVFSLDSDEEDSDVKQKDKKVPSPEKVAAPPAPAPAPARCGNPHCQGAGTTVAPALKLAAKRSLCGVCSELLDARLQSLMEGVKDLTPLLALEPTGGNADLVEISDSDSEDGGDDARNKPRPQLGDDAAKLLEEELTDMINDTWRKYKLDDRLAAATDDLETQMAELEKERLDIDMMLDKCQVATDALRRDLYAAFAVPQRQLPAIEIYDTLHAQFAKVITNEEETTESEPVRRSKRPRVPSKEENQAKRPAIPLGFTGDDKRESTESSADAGSKGDDDNTDIKVVALSAESAPAGLPALGTLQRQPVAAGMTVYGMKHAFGAWQRAVILQAPPRGDQPYSTCKVRFELKTKNNPAMLSARNLAYAEPASVRLTIATRVIALSQEHGNKKKSFYSGVIAEMPNPVNSYRYLVFFDGGYAQYVPHCDTRVVCECSPLVWEEVHPFSREFVREYLRAYPERPMVRLHAGQTIKTEWNGKWWVSRVIRVDASLVEVHFEADNRFEWIYRGSTRLAPLYLELQAAERHRARPMPRSTQGKRNLPYVEYTRSDEQESNKIATQLQAEQEMKRQRAVAKKSTTLQNNQQAPLPALSQDAVMSRVVYYTPKAAVKPHKMTPHICSIKCRRSDVLPLKELRTYNPLARPLLSGWERQLVRHKGRKEVLYRAPCGRRLRNVRELHRYLRAVGSEMAVDLFDFSATTHCLAEFVLNRCLVSKKDLSHGKENVPVPCVNYYDTSLPEFCSYNTERTPTAGVPLNLDPDFLCGCDCEDDCQDKNKCACWKLTLDGARTVHQDGDEVGYVYKRLLEPVPSGIYECNSRCKCKQTCLNRVAQHPLQLKLQVFKTPNRGWGIRALNDVPKGAFLCVYAGNLLTDATANLDGLNEGDEYLAELDYIEVVEQMKEGYEQDIPDRDKELDNKESRGSGAETDSASASEDERQDERSELADGDFQPVRPVDTQTEFSKRLRRRERRDKMKKDNEAEQPKETGEREGDCITISDDEEVREPSRFMAQAGMGSNDHVSKYRSVRSFFGEDEACYIMDAKVQGNIGRYLNHSCCPNVFVQNVFVDTHDPRFPWVAFFALSHIRAGTELTWNYNYDVGSVPDKILYCYCGAPNCRGRLL